MLPALTHARDAGLVCELGIKKCGISTDSPGANSPNYPFRRRLAKTEAKLGTRGTKKKKPTRRKEGKSQKFAASRNLGAVFFFFAIFPFSCL